MNLTERLVLFVVRSAYYVAIGLSDWVDVRRMARKKVAKKLTVKDIMELRGPGAKAYQRSNAPTIVVPPPSERDKPGGGSSRY